MIYRFKIKRRPKWNNDSNYSYPLIMIVEIIINRSFARTMLNSGAGIIIDFLRTGLPVTGKT